MDREDEDEKSGKIDALIHSSKNGVRVEIDKESEFNALLPPKKGCLSRKSDKLRRSVQWNDKNGNKLFEVLEFQASDVSDSDDEDSDSCMCKII